MHQPTAASAGPLADLDAPRFTDLSGGKYRAGFERVARSHGRQLRVTAGPAGDSTDPLIKLQVVHEADAHWPTQRIALTAPEAAALAAELLNAACWLVTQQRGQAPQVAQPEATDSDFGTFCEFGDRPGWR